MNILTGLGHAAGGFARGAILGEHIQEMKDKRENRRIEKEIQQAGIDILNQEDEEPITVENPTGGIAPPGSTQNSQLPVGLSTLDYTSPNEQTQVVQKFADGGMVQDQNSLVSQVNQASGLSSMQPQQQVAPVAKQRSNPGIKLSKAYNAMRDKAIELGRPDLAMQYQQVGFQVRDRMFKEGLQGAQRAYETTGDIGGFVKLYDSIDDGVDVTGYERTPAGYKIKFSSNGQEAEREFTPDQIRDMVMNFNDPAARYAAERQAMAAREKKTFETDEEIRKQNAIEAGKTHERDPYKTYVDGSGKVVQEAKEKPDGWKNNIQSVPGGYIQKNADGSETFVSTNGKGTNGSGTGKPPKDWNKEMLPVLKEVSDNILGFEGMGTQDPNTGKVTPTKQGNEAMVFGQRLLKQNPDLLPADVAKLAHAAATDPNATDYEVIERSDGSRYKRQVIKSGGQIYQLSNAAGSEIKPESKPDKPKEAKQQVKPQSKPSPRKSVEVTLGSVRPNQEQQPYQFQEQVQGQPSSFDVDAARQAMGTGKKDWYERRPSTSVGLGSVVIRDADRKL